MKATGFVRIRPICDSLDLFDCAAIGSVSRAPHSLRIEVALLSQLLGPAQELLVRSPLRSCCLLKLPSCDAFLLL
ncbi:hypothetical protein XH90_03505 [Bradyrhizobium sp. CCBAU 53338]|nr:hypothetical protein XH90_03505 [Bradyrhizobium sp. CCBAU 53338]